MTVFESCGVIEKSRGWLGEGANRMAYHAAGLTSEVVVRDKERKRERDLIAIS